MISELKAGYKATLDKYQKLNEQAKRLSKMISLLRLIVFLIALSLFISLLPIILFRHWLFHWLSVPGFSSP